MPLYRFQNKSGDVVERFCSVAEYEDVETDMERQGFERVFSLNIMSGTPRLSGISDGFNDLLKKIDKEAGRHSRVKTK